MLNLKLFVIAFDSVNNHRVYSFTEYQAFVQKIQDIHNETSSNILLHVGFELPPNDTYKKLNHLNKVICCTTTARDALPSKIIANSKYFTIGDNQKIYEITSEFRLEFKKNNKINNPPKKQNIINITEWLKKLKSTHSELYEKFSNEGIVDNVSYLQFENKLSDMDRHTLGTLFYSFITKDKLPTNHIEVLNNCPPWFLERTLSSIRFSVRLSNIITNLNIQFVKDLKKISVAQLLDLKNFGKKSQTELARLLHNAVSEGPQNSKAKSFQLKDNSTFMEELSLELEVLPRNMAIVLTRRLGLKEKSVSLAKVAKELGVTRERIRQIEEKGKRNLAHITSPLGKFSQQLMALRKDKSQVVYLDLIHTLHPWFKGLEEITPTIELMINKKWLKNVFLIKVNNRKIITGTNQAEWDTAISKGVKLADSLVISTRDLDSISEQIKAFLPEECSELSDVFWEVLQTFFIVSKEGDFIGVSTSIESSVRAILQNANEPMHFEDVTRLIKELTNRDWSAPRINSTCHKIGYFFDLGIFGMEHHFKFSQHQTDEVIAKCENIISNGTVGRQWHSEELVDLLKNILNFKLTRYDIDIMLDNSNKLLNLKRHTWQLIDNSNQSHHQERIDIQELVKFILLEKGQPMTVSEIKTEITKYRGLNSHFQVFEIPPVKQIKRGLWGIDGNETTN